MSFHYTQPATGSISLAGTGSVTLSGVAQGLGTTLPVSASAVATTLNSLPLLQYRLTPLTASDGQYVAMQGDANGNLKGVEQYAPGYENNVLNVAQVQTLPVVSPTFAFSSFVSTALASSHVVKASPGVLYALTARIDSAASSSTYYMQLVDNTSYALGVLKSTLKIQHTAGTDSVRTFDFRDQGIYFGTGIVFGMSTAETTITTSGSLTFVANALYK